MCLVSETLSFWMIVSCSSSCLGQSEEKGRAVAFLGLHPYLAIARVYDLLNDGKADSGAPVLARGGTIILIEPREYFVERLSRDANTRVHDRNLCFIAAWLQPDGDAAAILIELDGV